jgi:hypothetical protein
MDAGSIGALSGPAFFVMIAAIVSVPRWFRVREREALQATLRAAIEKGQPLPPEVIDAIGRDARPVPSSGRDLRTGIILLCVAAAFAAMGVVGGYYSDGDFEGVGWMIGIAAFPGFIGLAFVIMALVNRGKGRV